MEEEVRRILNRAVSLASDEFGLGTKLSHIGQQLELSAVDPFELPARQERVRDPLDFSQPDFGPLDLDDPTDHL